MKEIQFQVEIHATKEKVWHTLWQDETFREWAGLIDSGTYMTGELKEGNEVQFISSENGYGVTSLVEKLIPQASFYCSGTKLIHKRAENRSAKKNGLAAKRATRSQKKAAQHNLAATFDVPPEMEEYFKLNYPKALGRLKVLAES